MNQRGEAGVNPKPAVAEVAGHFGELVQGRLGPGGPVVLVTLPCPVLVTRVRYLPEPGPLTSREAQSQKAIRAARAALKRVGAAEWGGEIAIERPCPTGLGAGTSTAEALGAIRAVAQAFGAGFTPEREATLCLEAEGAVDPLMHEGTVLFASREGRVVRELPGLPAMRVVGGFAGQARATDPRDRDFAEAGGLTDRLAAALAARDARALGRVATLSAEANQRLRPNPAFARVAAIAAEAGAHGLAVGHTGAAIAVLLAPDAAEAAGGVARLMREAGVRDVIGWQVG